MRYTKINWYSVFFIKKPDFVFACRRGMDTTNFDIVIGGVANDKVFNTVELFFDGLIDKKEALGRLQRQLMSKGISDMHCRSDLYLVEELTREYR